MIETAGSGAPEAVRLSVTRSGATWPPGLGVRAAPMPGFGERGGGGGGRGGRGATVRSAGPGRSASGGTSGGGAAGGPSSLGRPSKRAGILALSGRVEEERAGGGPSGIVAPWTSSLARAPAGASSLDRPPGRSGFLGPNLRGGGGGGAEQPVDAEGSASATSACAVIASEPRKAGSISAKVVWPDYKRSHKETQR